MDRVKELIQSLVAISPMPDEEDPAMTDELIKQYCNLVQELDVIFKKRGIESADAWIIAPLIASFGSDTSYGCGWTVRHLLERFPPAILRPELRRGLESGKRGPRVWSAYLLGVQRDPADVPVLVAGLRDPEEEVRFNCVMALGMIGDLNAIPAMEELLRDPSAEVRKEAASAIDSLVSGKPDPPLSNGGS